MNKLTNITDPDGNEIDVGRQLRTLRKEKGLSIRALAELSSLNFNTLSLIENGKTSPSVSTLQQLAHALRVPITAFFDTRPVKKSVVHQKAGSRPVGDLLTWDAGGYGSRVKISARSNPSS